MTRHTKEREASHAPIGGRSASWWLHKRSYAFFVLREISAVFVAWAVVLVLLLVRAVAQGEAEYRAFLDWPARRGSWCSTW